MTLMLAQIAETTQVEVGGIAQTLASAGPYSLAAVLIVALIALWRKLGQRESEMQAFSDKLLCAYKEQTRVVVQFTSTLDRNCKALERMEQVMRDYPPRNGGIQ